MIDFKSNVVAGTVLMRSAIQSPNYVAATSGWSINQDGSVEFNNGTIRGTLIVGTTTVTTVGTAGITVVGPNQTMTVNDSTGFSVARTTPDGRLARLDISNTTGDASLARISLKPISPTDLGNTVNSGFLQSFVSNTGIEQVTLQMISPFFSGKAAAALQVVGQSSGSGTDDSVIFLQAPTVQCTVNLGVSGNATVTGTIRVGPNNQEIGQGVIAGAHSLANSAAIGATETVILTANSGTFRAGHTYRASIYGEVTTSVVGLANNPVLRLRKTDAAGQIMGQTRCYCPVVTTGFPGDFEVLFDVSGSDVTATMVVTIQGAAGFNGLQAASGSNGRGFYIEDIGSAANPSLSNANIVTLV